MNSVRRHASRYTYVLGIVALFALPLSAAAVMDTVPPDLGQIALGSSEVAFALLFVAVAISVTLELLIRRRKSTALKQSRLVLFVKYCGCFAVLSMLGFLSFHLLPNSFLYVQLLPVYVPYLSLPRLLAYLPLPGIVLAVLAVYVGTRTYKQEKARVIPGIIMGLIAITMFASFFFPAGGGIPSFCTNNQGCQSLFEGAGCNAGSCVLLPPAPVVAPTP